MRSQNLQKAAFLLVFIMLDSAGVFAQAAASSSAQTEQTEVARLQRELESLRLQYEQRLVALETRIAALETRQSAAPPGQAHTAAPDAAAQTLSEDRAALEKALAAALGEAAGATTGAGQPPGGERRFMGGERTLQSLNPEVSVTGDVFGTIANRTGDPEANQFRFSEFEVALQSPLDPFSLVKAFVVQEDGEFRVEEAYVDWTSLPGGLGVRVGRFRNDFGKINRYHQHGLAQADRPLAHQVVFGEDGLNGLGTSVSWLTPPFLGDYNEVWFQVTNDENDVAFSGRGFDDPLFMVHETNYWDLSNAAYVEVGLSVATGVNDPAGRYRTQVYGIDWNYNWSPPAQALYRGLELRGEFLWSRRGTPPGIVNTRGAYTYATYKVNRQWFAGVRGDWTEVPEDPGYDLWGVSPYLEWWQSEWARLRFQYEFNSRRFEERDQRDHRLFFQVTWAVGPHKHEQY